MTTPKRSLSIPLRKGGFSLLEVLVSMALTLLLVALVVNMTGATVTGIAHSTHSLETHESVNRLLECLRDDLGGVSPTAESLPARFTLQTAPDKVVLAAVRTEARIVGLHRQGYYRHVEYSWDPESREVIRTAYHAAYDSEAAPPQGSAVSANHSLNAQRLAALTPAWMSGSAGEWLQSTQLTKARAAAQKAPLLADIETFEVECLGPDLRNLGSRWEEVRSLPRALQVRLTFQPRPGQSRGATFALIIPLDSWRPDRS